MAISFVGSVQYDGNHASPGPTLTYTSTGGNTLVLCGIVYAGTTSLNGISSITDSASNTWQYSTSNHQNPPSQQGTDGTNFYISFVAWSIGASAVTTVTVNDGTGNSDFWNVGLSEWSGVNSADTGAANSGTGTTFASTAITLGNSGDVVIGVCDTSAGNITGAPVGSTKFFTGDNVNVYELPGTTGSFTYTWPSSGTGDYAIAVMALSPAGGTSAPAGLPASSGAGNAAAGSVVLNMTI